MSIAKITEISAGSGTSFDDAIKQGLKRASKTIDNITSAWVEDQELKVQGGDVTEYRVKLKLTFVLND